MNHNGRRQIFFATCDMARMRCINSYLYAHKHMLCISLTKSLRNAAVTASEYARSWPNSIAQGKLHHALQHAL